MLASFIVIEHFTFVCDENSS